MFKLDGPIAGFMLGTLVWNSDHWQTLWFWLVVAGMIVHLTGMLWWATRTRIHRINFFHGREYIGSVIGREI